jgi:hypothetical protein
VIWNTNYTVFKLNYSELKRKIKLIAKYYQTKTNYEQKWTKWTERSTGTEILTFVLSYCCVGKSIDRKYFWSIDFYQADATVNWSILTQKVAETAEQIREKQKQNLEHYTEA